MKALGKNDVLIEKKSEHKSAKFSELYSMKGKEQKKQTEKDTETHIEMKEWHTADEWETKRAKNMRDECQITGGKGC